MADVEPLKTALVDACNQLTQAGVGAAQAAMVKAGLAQAPAGMDVGKPDISTAGSLASQAAQTMEAAYKCADALARLEERFPTPPDTPPPA
jgi:monomeric isocitrate dehydrogenase